VIKLEMIECVRHSDGRRFENLLDNEGVIAEREIGTAVWLDVWPEEEGLPDCPICGAPEGKCACRVPVGYS
jgi:hypothetical protein